MKKENAMRYSILSKYRTELMGAAMLWVMLFHSFDLDMGLPILEWVRAAGFGGVDIFILLSSMGLVLSLSKREQSYSAFMARRAGRVLPAYYLVMIPYTIFLILTKGAPWSALIWNGLLLYYWVHPAGAFNWYVAGAMTFYSVTPACFRRMRRSCRRELLTAAGILAGLAVCQVLMYDGYWYLLDVMYRVPVFFLGLLLGFYVLEERKLSGKDLLFWCVWLGLGAVYLFAMRYKFPPFQLPLCHLFLFTTVPMCLVLCQCFECLPLGWLRAGFRFLGRYSLEIYLLNVSLFSELELLRRFVHFGPSNRLYFLLSYIANIALALALHRIVELLRRFWSNLRENTRETA